MAEIIEDRVKQVSTSAGVGNFVMSSTIIGFRAFSSVMTIGDTFHGCIVAVDAAGIPTGEWETGYYTYLSANTIERTTVRSSSATSNAKVNFAAGTKHVFLDLLAYQIRRFNVASDVGATATPFGQTPTEYTSMTFQDEFSSATFDPDNWVPNMYYESNNATQNFSLSNGSLNIYPQVDSNAAFFSRTFATDGKFSQTFGFFEIEAKLPVGAGLNARFSLYANDEHEIDVLTAHSGAPSGSWATTDMHPVDYMMMRQTSIAAGRDEQRARNYITVPDLSATFHKYGVRWDASTIRFFFDGSQVGPVVNHTTMNVPMYLYVALWTDSEETVPVVGSGTLSSTNRYTPQGITNSFQINYVRAWQFA